MIGREAELTAVRAGIEAVMKGSGRLLVIAGEPGVGKTRISQEMMLACRDRGFVVATGRCYEPTSRYRTIRFWRRYPRCTLPPLNRYALSFPRAGHT